MGWIEPKTDWTESGNYFNAEDYNRIIGNLNYLRNEIDKLYPHIQELNLGEEKTYLSGIYAREFNEIENSLDYINSRSYNLEIGSKKVFAANKPTPLWTELNRIEQACLNIYTMLNAHIKALPVLSFTMGKQKGIKV